MKKIIELLKIFILNGIRRPFTVLWSLGFAAAIMVFAFFVNPESISSIIASYSVFLVAYTSTIMLAMTVSEDRENGMFRMLRTTKLSKLEYIGANFLISNIVTVLIAVALLVFGALRLGLEIKPLSMTLIILLTAFAHAGIGLIISAYVKRQKHVQFATGGVMLAMIVLSPVFYTMDRIPEFISFLPKIVPLTYSIEAMRTVTVEGSGLSRIILPLTVLALLSIVTVSVGYRKLEF